MREKTLVSPNPNPPAFLVFTPPPPFSHTALRELGEFHIPSNVLFPNVSSS